MKTRPVEAKLFNVDGRTDGRTDRQTDMTKLLVAFRNFSSPPSKGHKLLLCLYPYVTFTSKYCIGTVRKLLFITFQQAEHLPTHDNTLLPTRHPFNQLVNFQLFQVVRQVLRVLKLTDAIR
jgi:hypothetical protein